MGVIVSVVLAMLGSKSASGVGSSRLDVRNPGGAISPSALPIAPRGNGSPAPVSSSPPDRRSYSRPLQSGDQVVAGALPTGYVLVDTVVSNTNANLKNTDTASDTEPHLAIGPAHPNEIVISAFNSSWSSNGNAAIYVSTNGGSTWTKYFSIRPPTGRTVGAGCPCDQVLDFDRAGRLLGSFLNEVSSSGDVYTGSTTNAASASSWSWATLSGVAKKTDNPGGDNADQPWLRINRDPTTSTRDDAYVAYDDFTTSREMVSVSRGANPPNMVATRSVGGYNGFVNPGTRLAADHRNGWMYALFQYATGKNANGSVHIIYAVNRSKDAGNTWTLDSSSAGVNIAEADSNQPTPKFGTVNALLGGVDSLSVDPNNGDVYVVYGYRDPSTGKNRLASARLTTNSSGTLTVAYRRFVTGQVQTALPSVAVAGNGTIGVLYDTFDGFNASGYPVFSAHLAQSNDHGLTFSDVRLLGLASPAKNNGDPRQRVLGDYQSLRAFGNTFYGTFTANGAQFGRTVSTTDAIFLKAPAK